MRSKAYRKMMREHKKTLNKLNKQLQPWDSGFLLEYFVEGLRFMSDYYELGENVMQTEDTAAEVHKTLTQAIKEYELYDNAFENLFDPDFDAKMQGKTKSQFFAKCCSGEFVFSERSAACAKDEEKHWKKFWQLISKNFLRWWD